MVLLKSRGQGPKKLENFKINPSRIFNMNLDLAKAGLWIRQVNTNIIKYGSF